MGAIVTIGGADKSGALARISSYLSRKGYGPSGGKITESASGKLLSINLDAAKVDKDRLSAELKSLSPEYSVVSVEAGEAAAAGAPTQSGDALIREMASRFPDIAPLVRAYGDSFPAESRDAELFEAGKRIGAFSYAKDWALGSPLKMPVALRRTLVPALEEFGKVEASDTSVALPESPFCAGQRSNCQFVTGFIQGFLDAGPLTQGTRVQRKTCKAKGHVQCAYAVDYKV